MKSPIEQLRELVAAQGLNGTWNYDPYMQGMFNGLELAVATMDGREPVFRKAPERWLADIPSPDIEATAGVPVVHDSRAAMQTALDALTLAENYSDHPDYERTMAEAIAGLRSALGVKEGLHQVPGPSTTDGV